MGDFRDGVVPGLDQPFYIPRRQPIHLQSREKRGDLLFQHHRIVRFVRHQHINVTLRPRVRYVGHFGDRGWNGHPFDVRNHVPAADQLHHRTDADLVVFDEFPVEPSRVLDLHPADVHRVHTHPRFQVPGLARRPHHVGHLGFRHLVRDHHLERKRVFRVFVGAFVHAIVRDNYTVDLVGIAIPPFHQRLRQHVVGKRPMGLVLDDVEPVLLQKRHLLTGRQHGSNDLVGHEVNVASFGCVDFLLVDDPRNHVADVGRGVFVVRVERRFRHNEFASDDGVFDHRKRDVLQQMRHVLANRPVSACVQLSLAIQGVIETADPVEFARQYIRSCVGLFPGRQRVGGRFDLVH